MSYSHPDRNYTPPTYEDVVAYAEKEGLLGKVSIDRFYDYYSKLDFMYRGYLMDWKSKLHEWADKQRTQVTVSAREYNAKPKAQINVGLLDEIKAAFSLA